MLKRTQVSRLSFWEMPIAEQINILKWWKSGADGGDRDTFAKDLPRTVHGYYEYCHPRTEDICRYYPYRRDLVINNSPRRTFVQLLEEFYVPPMLTDEQRVEYVAVKSGRTEKDVAKELFRMRRLRCAIAQTFRDKLTGNWVRQIAGDWNLTERKYLESAHKSAAMFGMDFWNSHSYDPYVMYSPFYQTGDMCDIVLNKTVRTAQTYLFIEVCVHNTVPRARLPGVIGQCKTPLQDWEPSIYNLYELKLSMLAYLAKKEQFVVDHALDTNHSYKGAILHYFRGSDLDEVEFEVLPLELDVERAEVVLRHYYDNFVAPYGASREGDVGQMS